MMKIERVCIIDDDPIFVFGVQRFMKFVQLGNKFDHFVNGKEAINGIEKMRANKEKLPDLIMVDLNMPVMDGWQFLDAFNDLPLETQPLVFIVSSSIDPIDLKKVKNYPIVSEFVFKPITVQKLKELVSIYQKS